jgi:hypothetical protein
MSSRGQYEIRGPTYADRELAEAELQVIREAQKHDLAGGTNEMVDLPWLRIEPSRIIGSSLSQ